MSPLGGSTDPSTEHVATELFLAACSSVLTDNWEHGQIVFRGPTYSQPGEQICRRVPPPLLHNTCITSRRHSEVLSGTQRHTVSAAQRTDLQVRLAFTQGEGRGFETLSAAHREMACSPACLEGDVLLLERIGNDAA